MCGIAGILNFNQATIVVDELKIMTNALIHRGPDGEGQWIGNSGQIGLGHRRLSIIDLTETGAQPMHYFDNRYTITFNGEIYNYIELKENLIQKGYSFSSNSDTEVLLALYHDKGESCLCDLDGMFAFAIWDNEKEELFCARDRFGEKPFYYTFFNETFYFASEMKALWAVGIPKKPIPERVEAYLKKGIINNPKDRCETFYDAIYELANAECMVISKLGKKTNKKYWEINIQKLSLLNKGISIEEATQKFYDLLKQSVNRRLRSDVTIGSSLSGGLDSSVIVSLMNNNLADNQRQVCINASFPLFEKDESTYAKIVANSLNNVELQTVFPDDKGLLENLDKLIYHQEEPFGSASIYAQLAVYQKAKENNIVVMLDGQGADEFLGGYFPFYENYLLQLYYYDKKKYEKELEAFNKMHVLQHQIKSQKSQQTFRMRMGFFKKKLLKQPFEISPFYFKQTLYNSLFGIGLNQLLRYSDRNAMSQSIEVRLPFLNHELIEFVFTLPDEMLLKNGWTKFILRNAFTNKLPNEIVWRKDKIGYEPPQQNWLKNETIAQKIALVKNQLNEPLQSSNGYLNDADWRCLLVNEYFN